MIAPARPDAIELQLVRVYTEAELDWAIETAAEQAAIKMAVHWRKRVRDTFTAGVGIGFCVGLLFGFYCGWR